MDIQTKLFKIYTALEIKVEQENQKRLVLAKKLNEISRVAFVLNIIAVLFRGLLLAGISGIVAFMSYAYSRQMKRAPAKVFLPLRARDYISQQNHFYSRLNSEEPFILILRSFEQFNISDQKTQDGALDKFLKRELEYEDEFENFVEKLDKALDFPINAIYVGKTRSCCSIDGLKKSLFLISQDNWFDVVKYLIEKSSFIVLMPGNTKGLIDEVSFLSTNGINKTYFFLPNVEQRSNKMLDSWLKTFEEFQKLGLKFPYENTSKSDFIFKVEEDFVSSTNFRDASMNANKNGFTAIKVALSELIKKKYISNNYYEEGSKYFPIGEVLKEFQIENIFGDIAKEYEMKTIELNKNRLNIHNLSSPVVTDSIPLSERLKNQYQTNLVGLNVVEKEKDIEQFTSGFENYSEKTVKGLFFLLVLLITFFIFYVNRKK